MDSPKPHTVWIKTEDDSNTSSNIEETCKPSISNGFQEDVITKRRRMHKNEILGTYNLARLVTELSTREQAVIFAEEHGLILKKKICGRHKKSMVIGYNDRCSVGYFTCYAKICKGNRITRAKNTFFSQCKLSLKHVYYLMYCYAHRWSHEQVIWEDILKEEEEHCLSAPTISEWYGACRDAVVLYQLDKQSYQGKIGGPGKVVQIDKHVFGKRKELRKQARLLENDIDMKLVAFSKLSISSNSTTLDSENAPLINTDDMFDTMSMEIQQLLNKLSSINDKMADIAPGGAATMHTIKRHREILMDYQQEFTKTGARVAARREREELLRGGSPPPGHTPGLNRRDQYAKEASHLHSSHMLVDEQINIAMEAREHLASQRHAFKRMQTTFNNITNRFPMLNSLIFRINARKRRDSLIIGLVVAVCTFLLLLYAFH